MRSQGGALKGEAKIETNLFNLVTIFLLYLSCTKTGMVSAKETLEWKTSL